VRPAGSLPTDDALAFRHDLLWQAVTDSLPASLRLQAGHVLLDCGGSAVPAAAHFMSSAGPGGARALAGLDRAAREVLPTSPQTAELAVRAPSSSPDTARFDRTMAAVVAPTCAGRLSEAAEFARTGLNQAPPDQAARLRNEPALIQGPIPYGHYSSPYRHSEQSVGRIG
jgi:hypothetical protein